MPVIVPDNLPAIQMLKEENVFVIQNTKAIRQDIRPLRLLILNIMPLKIKSETQLLRLLTNTPLQVEIDLLHTKSHKSKNTAEAHLEYFYKTFSEVSSHKYDGMIITGAPVEHLHFEDVSYWEEIRAIMEWSVHNVTSTLFICWAAQAALYHFFNIQKYPLENKLSGNYYHHILNRYDPIVRGFDDGFQAPHSRHTTTRREDILLASDLEIIAESESAGVYLIVRRNHRQVFITGHSEYEPHTLKEEYERDRKAGLNPKIPENYFPENNPNLQPFVNWRSHANLLFQNWLNFYVYQRTPFNIQEIK